ncbi:UDP-N-acetylmuramoyl-L-alanine--D-glutamate ligase [Candidatus Chlorohelix sp.]|uniref:UDP-N-acetylmuramoyl-L-alanine--D-glutamate ligase n=1 Tax=Candidatus Chlorohelix sp. TaxID=3139201 RepID=UPI003023370C
MAVWLGNGDDRGSVGAIVKMELKGKKALVMGLGLHDGGLGVTKFLVAQGAEVTVTDLRSLEVLQPTLERLEGLPIKYVFGEHREEDFRNAELVIRNPAVPLESSYLKIAREAGAQIEMELTLFYKLCRSHKIIGVTGTRGKTTSTLLLGTIMKEWRSDTVVAGNLRVSALNKLDEIGEDTPVALEISCWQLEGFGEKGISPSYAAVTNLSPDHLNRYRDMADYANSKRWIYRNQAKEGVVFLNLNDAMVRTFAEDAPGKVGWFAFNPLPEDKAGTFLRDEVIIWRDWDGNEEEICSSNALKLPGAHNLMNALTATALAKAVGVPVAAIRRGIENFKGVPDRLEFVREIHGVRFINDTTSTSPAGVLAALEAMRHSENSDIVLIAGGADKNLQFEGMATAIANPQNRVRAIVLLKGSATPLLQEALAQAGLSEKLLYGPFDDFPAAVTLSGELAKEGGLVLLSPGCASFGLFIHEFERGERFREIVRRL